MASVAIIHGRDFNAVQVVKLTLAALGHEPRDFDNSKCDVTDLQFNYDIVLKLIADCDAVVTILTPDETSLLDQALLGPGEEYLEISRVRPNVMLELGIAIGMEKKVFVISFGFSHSDVPSDLMGLNPYLYRNSANLKKDLSNWFNKLSLSCAEVTNSEIIPDYAAPHARIGDPKPPYVHIVSKHTLPTREIRTDDLERSEYDAAGYEVTYFDEQDVDMRRREGWQPYVMRTVDGIFVWPKFKKYESQYAFYLCRKRSS